MDSTDDFNQGGGGRNFLATAREKFFTRTDFIKFGDDSRLHVRWSIFIRQFERGACVDAGTFAQIGGKYFRRDNFESGDKKIEVVNVKKIKAGAIPDEVMEFTLAEMQKILSGEIIFVAQDGRLMQVEVTQRRRLVDWSEKISTWSDELQLTLRKQISQEFSTLAYGRLVIKIQKGRVTQMERTVQSRFTGLDGEGI